VFQAFPLLIIPVSLYTLFAIFQNLSGSSAEANQHLLQSLLNIPMPMGRQWAVSLGDMLITLGLFTLFFELIRATNNNRVAIINHSLSMIVFIVALVAFLLFPAFETSTFGLLVLMTLLDVLAGFIVTIVSSRRELNIEPAAH
jgi:hypothetical protein